MEVKSIGKEIAMELYDTKWWEGCSPKMIAFFQLFTTELCCPFDVFKSAVASVIGRDVWTHEFTGPEVQDLRAQVLEKMTQGRTQ